jgi:archaellum component FlaF (FlaF/FlaG flagellin family)
MAKTFSVNGLSTGVTYIATAADAWVSLSQDGNNVTVTVTAYTSTSQDRTSSITITATDGATATLPVTQYKKSSLTLDPTSLSFDAAGN